MTRTCELCRQVGTKDNPINRHHYRGRKKGQSMPTMYTHAKTCHLFAEWITQLYIQRGDVNVLEPKHIVYFFNRVVTIREQGAFVLPLY